MVTTIEEVWLRYEGLTLVVRTPEELRKDHDLRHKRLASIPALECEKQDERKERREEGQNRSLVTKGWSGPVPVVEMNAFRADSDVFNLKRALPKKPPEPSSLEFGPSLDRAWIDCGAEYCDVAEDELIREGVLAPVDSQDKYDRERAKKIGERVDEKYTIPDVQCSLGPGWAGNTIKAYGQQTPTYRASRAGVNPYKALRLLLLELDDVFLSVHPMLSNVQRCAFWASVEVRCFIRQYCTDLLVPASNPDDIWSTVEYIEGQLSSGVNQALRRRPLSSYLADFVIPGVQDEDDAPALPRAQTKTERQFEDFLAKVNQYGANHGKHRVYEKHFRWVAGAEHTSDRLGYKDGTSLRYWKRERPDRKKAPHQACEAFKRTLTRAPDKFFRALEGIEKRRAGDE